MITWTDIKRRQEDMKHNKRVKRIGLTVTILFAIFACLVINYQRISLQKKQQEYLNKIEKLDEKYVEEEDRTEEIKEYKAYIQTKQFAEEYAREKMGLVYPDEILFQAEED